MSNKTFIAIVVVVVIVGIGIVFFAVYKGPHSGSGSSSVAGTPAAGGTTGATQQFPTGLIIDPSSTATPSYSSATGQYTATYTSADPAATLYAAYKNYFASNGWGIRSETAPEGGSVGSFYARSSAGDAANVTIAQGASSGSQVTVNFTP